MHFISGLGANRDTHRPSACKALSVSHLSDQGGRLAHHSRQRLGHRWPGLEERLLVGSLGFGYAGFAPLRLGDAISVVGRQ